MEPEDPPHVLFVGRLSEEKGVLELVEAAQGLPLVVVGDGPLRDRVPGTLGFVPPASCPATSTGRRWWSARRAVRATASLPARRWRTAGRSRDGRRRPVEAVLDGETGLLVAPGDVPALRAALERLLGDADLRACLGAAGRERARERYSRDVAATATLAAYEAALS